MTSTRYSSLALLAIIACNSVASFGGVAHAFSLGPFPATTSTMAPSVRRFSVLHASEADETAAEKPKKQAPPPPPPIDVSKLDIRVGLIEKCWEHEEADKLFCEEINIGEDEPRSIASGLKAHYTSEEMTGKKVLVLANLKSRKMVGFPSHGMVLCAVKEGESEDGSEDIVELLSPPEGAVPGDRIVCAGFEGEPATENQVIKKKMLNTIFPDLKVNSEGVAVYKDVPLAIGEGDEASVVTSGSLKDVIIS
ncbi:unnamed protein product [Pseudo-nitzschia multistriata]|uniref:tRNA-binding domain-containing protein n=1 Tax=Pseudo-nitzschia multistriata TaxID=183589 RepID=A0A448YYW2_9STRA|nr:unnamed protein product [Pseudo-nitzschia multistriata]